MKWAPVDPHTVPATKAKPGGETHPLYGGRDAHRHMWAVRGWAQWALPLSFILSLLSPRLARSAAQFEQLPPIPDPEGFAGAFAGVADGCLLVAGGANFPDKKPWENGKKIWYDTVFMLDRPNGQWRKAGKLPRPLGYGVSITTSNGVLCVGGSDAERHHSGVFLLSLRYGEVRTEKLPGLPVPLANAAGALIGNTALVFGGSSEPNEQAALNRLFALDLSLSHPAWRELEACPGKPRILPVAAVIKESFYIAGGAALEPTKGKPGRVYLHDAWRYQIGKGWERMADLPRPAVAAPTPAPAWDQKFYIFGGDDGSLVGFQPVQQHPGFPKSVLTYDARSNIWNLGAGLPVSRAVLPTAFWRGRWILPNGEVRPGVRSPEVWSVRLDTN